MPVSGRARVLRNAQVRLGAALVGAVALFALLAPWFSPHDGITSEFSRGAAPLGPVGPSSEFWLGADRLYRDQLTRLALGGRTSLWIGLASTALATSVGALVGVLAGYYEGARGARLPWLVVGGLVALLGLTVFGPPVVTTKVFAHHGVLPLVGLAGLAALGRAFLRAGPEISLDAALMRSVDIGLAFPFLLLVMALASVFERTSATTILLTLGFTGWLGIARIVRAKTIQVRNQEYVTAARALGQSTPRILWLHVLPNVAGPIVVLATLSVAQMIVAESVMSYLGVGLSPPTATWGYMLFEGQEVYATAPWLLAAPFAAILACVLGFNLLGDGLRDALDPRSE
ncbi:MAG TPA: ABC transporter permease [Polyangiaceae bacterium]|nr:ABC transporter permease [Polyangiaceae bacterium]